MKKINWKYVKLARWLVRYIDHGVYQWTTSTLSTMLIIFGAINFGVFLYASIVNFVNVPMKILGMIVGIFMILYAIWEIRFYNYISIEWVNKTYNGDMNDELTKRLWEGERE
jgi:hypothetical protein